MRIASELGRQSGAQVLITGESLGQVASQTLENMTVIERAAALPIMRPLVGMDKNEIINEARRLGTFETSILPDEDCCTLLAPRRAVTWTDPEPLIELERRVDVESVVERLVGQALVMWPRVDRPASGEATESASGEAAEPASGGRAALRSGEPAAPASAAA